MSIETNTSSVDWNLMQQGSWNSPVTTTPKSTVITTSTKLIHDIVQGDHVSPTNHNAGHINYSHGKNDFKTVTTQSILWETDGFGNEVWKDFVFTSEEHPGQKFVYYPINDGKCPVFQGNVTNVRNNPNIISKIQAECLAGLNQNKIQLGISIAEANKTASTLASLSRDLFNVIRGIKTGNLRLVQRSLRSKSVNRHYKRGPRTLNYKRKKDRKAFHDSTIEDRYLQYTYGITPMVYDAYALTDILVNDKLSKKLTVVSEARDFEKEKLFYSLPDSTTLKTNSMSFYNCKIMASIDNAWGTMTELGLTNPALVAWELVPFSFLVDWVLPIGTLLEAVNAKVGLTFTNGYYSVYRTGDTVYKQSYSLNGSGVVYTRGGTTNSSAAGYMRRTYQGFPPVKPFIKSPFSVRHGLTSLALLKKVLH